ncbi:hypothetical protein MRX96_004919 [Rhipicephalus microplus]
MRRCTDRFVKSSWSPDADLHRFPRHRPVHLFHGGGVPPRPGMVHPAAPSQEQAGAALPAAAAVLHRLLGTAAGARLGVHVVRAPGSLGHAGHRRAVKLNPRGRNTSVATIHGGCGGTDYSPAKLHVRSRHFTPSASIAECEFHFRPGPLDGCD